MNDQETRLVRWGRNALAAAMIIGGIAGCLWLLSVLLRCCHE